MLKTRKAFVDQLERDLAAQEARLVEHPISPPNYQDVSLKVFSPISVKVQSLTIENGQGKSVHRVIGGRRMRRAST